MNYNEQLNSKEWKSKREEIILRDNSRCTRCNIERNKILGLSSKFGIKEYDELNDELKKKEYRYIGKFEQMPDISDLKYALQWIEPKNKFMFSRWERICFDKDTQIMYDLNVHHKYYISGKMAWEYKNEALITLCATCHKAEHLNNLIPVMNENGDVLHYAENCPKCLGSGVLSEYDYYKNGICFQCMGTGSINF